jgi:hypothetical protein
MFPPAALTRPHTPSPPQAEDAEVARTISCLAMGGALGSASISSSMSELTAFPARQPSM